MSPLRNYIFAAVRFAVPVAILGYLVASIDRQQLAALRDQSVRWDLLAVAFLLVLAAVCITFVRWYLLVRALEMPFRLRDAFRLGFLGYLLNFVSIGAVGGDLFKAVFIAREQHGRRAEAVATVVVDRMIGLYALLLVTSGALLISGIDSSTAWLAVVRNVSYCGTAIGAVAIFAVLTPGFTSGSVSEFLGGLPRVGPTIAKLIAAVRMYRNRPGVLAVIALISLGVHSMFAASMYFAANALYDQTPTFTEQLIVVPLANLVAALPISPAGIGTFEAAFTALYANVPAAPPAEGSGVLIALLFRLMTIGVAMFGVVYYWTARREVRETLRAASLDNDEPAVPTKV